MCGAPARLVSSGVMAEQEYRVLRPNGEMRWVRSLGKLIHSRDGRPERPPVDAVRRDRTIALSDASAVGVMLVKVDRRREP